LNSEHIADVIYSVLRGEDYRKYVMATINERFINEIINILATAAYYKKNYGDRWINTLIDTLFRARGKDAKKRLTWVVGLNEKTVHNMAGTTKKEVIVELGKANIESIKLLVKDMLSEDKPVPELVVKYDGNDIRFGSKETFLLFNTIATAKLTIQGGAWSEVGKQVEKALLYVLFNLLEVPPRNYLLDQEKIDKIAKKLGISRDIDGIIVNDNNEYLTVEVKLLGIGNPEIIDEALARNPNLFITDQSTPMMKEEVKKKGIATIVLREDKFAGTIKKLAKFFDENSVSYSADPESVAKIDNRELKDKIVSYVEEFLSRYINLTRSSKKCKKDSIPSTLPQRLK